MATKKFLELKEFSVEELQAEIATTRAQYSKMKFDHAIKGLENPLALREVRRDIARMSTELNRRSLENINPAERIKIRARRRSNK